MGRQESYEDMDQPLFAREQQSQVLKKSREQPSQMLNKEFHNCNSQPDKSIQNIVTAQKFQIG